ncbi:hypothetical protein NC651_002009 [Populus alba x Populus x berolinensis]|nr:hypothetical protein NC651_002009 [Populus alba x Populus x berolinensis]
MAIFSPSSAYPKPLPFPTQNPSPLPFSIHSLRLSLPPSPPCTSPTTRLRRCHAALPPLPPPRSDPPPGKDPQGVYRWVVVSARSNFSKLKRYDVCLCNSIGSRPKNITISLSGLEGVMVSHLVRPYVPLVVPWSLFPKLCGGDEFLDATLSQLQDRVQIFLAVLFWMSLFFWASIWDGKNNGRGRLNKGSRFKR